MFRTLVAAAALSLLCAPARANPIPCCQLTRLPGTGTKLVLQFKAAKGCVKPSGTLPQASAITATVDGKPLPLSWAKKGEDKLFVTFEASTSYDPYGGMKWYEVGIDLGGGQSCKNKIGLGGTKQDYGGVPAPDKGSGKDTGLDRGGPADSAGINPVKDDDSGCAVAGSRTAGWPLLLLGLILRRRRTLTCPARRE